MNLKTLACLLTGLLTGIAGHANAASVSVIPTSVTTKLAAGDLVSFEIHMDCTSNDSGLGSDITVGGSYDVLWDENGFNFSGIDFVAELDVNFNSIKITTVPVPATPSCKLVIHSLQHQLGKPRDFDTKFNRLDDIDLRPNP